MNNSGEYTAMDPSYCLVHGAGARVLRQLQDGRTTAGSVSWWVCPQCTAALQQETQNNPILFDPTWNIRSVTMLEGLESLIAAAKEAKVVLYDDPRTIDYDSLEPGVRVACRRINESGWCFTAESCHGHVHDEDRWGGSWGDDPFLRLTARRKHFGHMLALFARAMEFEEDGMDRSLSFTVFRDTRGAPEFDQAIIRIPTGRVYVRNEALKAFERFGELVNQELPSA